MKDKENLAWNSRYFSVCSSNYNDIVRYSSLFHSNAMVSVMINCLCRCLYTAFSIDVPFRQAVMSSMWSRNTSQPNLICIHDQNSGKGKGRKRRYVVTYFSQVEVKLGYDVFSQDERDFEMEESKRWKAEVEIYSSKMPQKRETFETEFSLSAYLSERILGITLLTEISYLIQLAEHWVGVTLADCLYQLMHIIGLSMSSNSHPTLSANVEQVLDILTKTLILI